MTDAEIPSPARGELWLVAFGAARKGEIGKSRPAIVVSVDGFRTGSQYDLITVIPLSATRPPGPLSPEIPAGQGLLRPSTALCHAPRACVPSRFLKRFGEIDDETLTRVIEARSVLEGWDD
jgi:mRNA interferase MazF